MKTIFSYLKSYSTIPIEVDRLIISSFVEINNLQIVNNKLLTAYLIDDTQIDESNRLFEFIEIVKKEINTFDIEKLIELFEFVVSPADRIVNGAVYTPKYIRDYIVERTFAMSNKALFLSKIADISCGCGGFLYTAAKAIKASTDLSYVEIFANHIYGVDIQEYSITRTKLLLSLLAVINGEDMPDYNFNLFVGDSLAFRWEEQLPKFNGFTIIIGNPPYVRLRNLTEETKSLLKNWEVCSTGLTDLYIPFFQIGIENLEPNGVLGYITMNSFFKSLNGRALRNYIQTRKPILEIIDFGSDQIFKSKNTYTCICFMQNTTNDFIEYKRIDHSSLYKDIKVSNINYNTLDSHKGWNLQESELNSKIEAIGQPFSEKYKTKHGIATLKNKIYIFKPVKEDSEYYYLREKSNLLHLIEKGVCKDIVNSNKINGTRTIDEIKEKIIFPYRYTDGSNKPTIIEEEIFKIEYPFAYQYLEGKKDILAKRDKGKGKYPKWYAFGRTQSLDKIANKLFFPKISNTPPTTIISSDENLLYYNGQAIINQDMVELKIIQKLMRSKVFWNYIKSTSKPYSSDYYSLNGNYINNFGICSLTKKEKEYIIKEDNMDLIDSFFEEKYR